MLWTHYCQRDFETIKKCHFDKSNVWSCVIDDLKYVISPVQDRLPNNTKKYFVPSSLTKVMLSTVPIKSQTQKVKQFDEWAQRIPSQSQAQDVFKDDEKFNDE
jgi:hypothetical protein